MSTDKSSGHTGDERNKDKNLEDDYLDLLRMADRKYADREPDSRDVYSDSSRRTANRNSDDITDRDVYIKKQPKRTNEADDIYIGKRPPRRSDDFIIDIDSGRDDRIPQPRPVVKRPTDEEISDFEVAHGIRKPKKKKNKPLRIFLSVVAVILVVSVAVGFLGINTANGVINSLTAAEEIEHIDAVDSLVKESGVKNILLIGLDKEKEGSSRSDSIMIASVNSNTGKVTLTSILRDSHVYIPGHDESKINSAYAWGEADLLVQTIETNFGIYIDDYATVNYSMFTKLVDGLGGIDIEVTEDEAYYINYEHEYKGATPPDTFESGESVHLNGYQALWYSRIRKLDSDFMRTYRQRKVMKAIISNVKSRISPTGIKELIKTAEAVAPYIETTLTKSECYSLLFMMTKCVKTSGLDPDKLLNSQKIPFEGTWEYSTGWDGSIVALDIDENKRLFYESVYEGKIIESETTE